MTVAAPIGMKIRTRRKARGLTQKALARHVGISASYLNLIESDRRAVGGRLLQRIAETLGLQLADLSGDQERRLVERLGELAADPSILQHHIDPASASALVSRHPDWAAALLSLSRAVRDADQQITALTDRLDQDPALMEAVHQVLNNAAAVRSTMEILSSVEDLPAEQRARFVEIVLSQSGELSGTAERLVTLFSAGNTRNRSLSPAEEVDDFLIQNQSYFPALEDAARDLRRDIRTFGQTIEGALNTFLLQRFGISVYNRSPVEADLSRFRNHSHFDAENRVLVFLDNAPPSTRQFQLARLVCQLTAPDLIDSVARDELLTSEDARSRARGALASWLAAAALFPYETFLEDAIRHRYDVELLRQRFSASVEQICQRLVSLRKPGAEGIPFGFLRADPSGHVSKRFPIAGLPIPRSGNGCPLWPLYGAFQTPDRVIRQLAEFPNGSRYLFIGRTVRHEPALFHEAPFLHAVMLACDEVHADQTVYADGLDFAARQMATPVGPNCRLCSRDNCLHRGEDSILYAR